MTERAPFLNDVDRLRATLRTTGTIPAKDALWLADKLESVWNAADHLKNSADAYITRLEEAVDSLKADIDVQNLSKDIEIHELKERLKEYDPNV